MNEEPKPPASGSRVKDGALPEETQTHDVALGESDPLSSIRHSLRTPLNQIIGYSEMLQEEAQDVGELDFLPDLQKIHTAGGQLLALINDGLAPWKVETGKIDLDTMRLEMRTPLNLIIGYAELCEEVAAEKNQEGFIADLRRINAAARKLLDLFNSTKFPTQLEFTAKVTKPGASAQATLGSTGAPGRPAEGRATQRGSILIVDDDSDNRDMLSRRLERHGYKIATVGNGQEALDILKTKQFDLVLLDILMPVLNGYDTLQRLKGDKTLRHIPVIMLSALDEIDGAVKCIEIGAEDYLPKPFNPVLLNARIGASLEKKQLHDQERAYLQVLQMEREKSERLLLNVLPKSIADRIKQGESTIADSFPEATVLFADIEDFTRLASNISPGDIIELLNEVFSGFDWLAELHGLEKIKTIGDAYMVVGGVPTPRENHADAIAEMALDMLKTIKRFAVGGVQKFNIRIGISSGPVVAGVIGRKKFIYDLWGDTVNVASRMESQGRSGAIQVSATTFELLKDKYQFEERGPIEIRSKGMMNTFFLTGRINRTML